MAHPSTIVASIVIGDPVEDRTQPSLAILLGATSLGTIFVTARLYSCMRLLHKRIGLEEWLIIAALVMVWSSNAMMMIAFQNGMGKHLVDLTIDQRTTATFWFVVGTPLSVLGLALPKLAVVSLLCRVFSPPAWHQRLLWGLAVFCLLNFVVVSALVVFPCQPVKAAWDATVVNSTCVPPWTFVHVCFYVASE